METHLKVVASRYDASETSESHEQAERLQAIRVTGGGPVIQILPGPLPFPDSAAPILKAFGDEREGLESQVKSGPYTNNVTPISGTFTFNAWDKGATRDSVDGTAEFVTQDGARWKLVMDRVQTKDVPHHPRFGGVIMGLYYHGVTQVHTPLVPTINSAVALWAVAHLYKNDVLVTDNAMVHVMLLSRTRRDGDFALSCWDCSKNKIEELQLLFWLSLVPFTTSWVGERPAAAIPTAIYGGVFLMSGVAWLLLQRALLRRNGPESLLARAVGRDLKGKLSALLYAAAILLAFVRPWIADAIYVLVALIWFVPDRRFERAIE